MANRDASNGGYDPSANWNAKTDLEIGVWNPPSSEAISNAQVSSQIPVATGVGGYQQSGPSHRPYSPGDINSNWRSGSPGSVPAPPQHSSYYNSSPQPGYTGQMVTPVSNTFPQYQNSSQPVTGQNFQSYVPDPQQIFSHQMPPGNELGQAYMDPDQQNFSQPELLAFASQMQPQISGQVELYGSPHSYANAWSSELQNVKNVESYGSPHSVGNNWVSESRQTQYSGKPQASSFTTAGSFKNPLMVDAPSTPEDATSDLIRKMHLQGEKAQKQMQNNTRYPTILSKASMAQLEQDFKQAAVAFESPEALKHAREKELGLHSVEDVGKIVVVSNLSVNAPDFVPRSKSPLQEHVPTQASSEQEKSLIANLETFIANVLTQPGSFDELSSGLINQVKYHLYSNDTVKKMVQIIFKTAIKEDNFKYLGARLCDRLTMPEILPNFRTIFLNHLQSEFKDIRSLVTENKEEQREKIHGFFMFMAEIFIHIKVNGEPLISLGRSLSKSLENLLRCTDIANIPFVCKILKLAGSRLRDAFEGNSTDVDNYLKVFTFLNEHAEKHKEKTDAESKRIALLISSVSRLKETNWGRTKSNTRPKSDIEDPEQYGDELSEVDQNYYMNEPVFFTPDGVQYTAAEAQIPEFYEQHLAKYNLRPDVPFDESSSYSWSKSDGFDDYVPSDEEEDFYRQQEEEAEYENEFEKFLAESGQFP